MPGKVKDTGSNVVKKFSSLFVKENKAVDNSLTSLLGETKGKGTFKLDLQFFANKTKTTVKYGEQYTRVNGKKVLKSNIEYTTKEGYKYATNANGNILSVEGTLQLGKGKRNGYAQRTVGKGNGSWVRRSFDN